MSIQDDFKPYVDGNNLLAPSPVSPIGQGSDNGPMFTSEYFITLKKLNLLTDTDVADFSQRIAACTSNEMLNRAPGDSDQEGPDDYYGVMNGCKELGITEYPRMFLLSLMKHVGFLNNNQPGVMTGSAFLARQPQLVASMISAAFPSMVNPLHWLTRVAAFPLFLVSAIVLLFSCRGAVQSDADSRRLAWHLGNNVSRVSLLNFLVYKVWLNRLYSHYPNGMKDVAAIYYQPNGNNPYSKWWVT